MVHCTVLPGLPKESVSGDNQRNGDSYWDAEGLLQGFPSAAVQAKKYSASFADLAKKVKAAAGAYLRHTCLVLNFA